MATRDSLVALIAASATVIASRSARAQPDLPPPPPPPIDQPSDVPSLPPPPEPPSTPEPFVPARRAPSPAPAGTRTRRRPEARTETRDEPEVAAGPAPPARGVAITWNPAGLFWGRLSANVEVQLAPHHALIVSPNVLVFRANRGSMESLVSEGLGFASPSSLGGGAEVGYHYWLLAAGPLRGVFFGPSFLFGATTHASTGNPSHTQGYWGFGADVGVEQVIFDGFTAGAGVGLGLLRMADTTALVPRLLCQVGWMF
jgi:hypothetical protein